MVNPKINEAARIVVHTTAVVERNGLAAGDFCSISFSG
jgi:hypothetical protein